MKRNESPSIKAAKEFKDWWQKLSPEERLEHAAFMAKGWSKAENQKFEEQHVRTFKTLRRNWLSCFGIRGKPEINQAFVTRCLLLRDFLPVEKAGMSRERVTSLSDS